MRSRTLLVGSIVALAAVLAVGGFTRMTSASFTDGLTTGGNSVTVDKLSNHFAVTPGSSATGNVDSLSINLGLVTSPQTITNVFTVRNVSSMTRTATLVVLGPEPARLRLLRPVRQRERHARPGSLERRLPDDLPLRRRPRHRPDQAQARQLDLALPRLLGHARRGACGARQPDRHGDRGRRHQARLAGLHHDDEPRRLRRLPLDRRHLDEAQHLADHGHHLDGHVPDERHPVLLSRARSLERDALVRERRQPDRDGARRLDCAHAPFGRRARQRRGSGQRLHQPREPRLGLRHRDAPLDLGLHRRRDGDASRGAAPRSPRARPRRTAPARSRSPASTPPPFRTARSRSRQPPPTRPATRPPRGRRPPPRTRLRRTRPPRPTRTATTRHDRINGTCEANATITATRTVPSAAGPVHGDRHQRRHLHRHRRPRRRADLEPDHGHLPRDGDRPGREHERGDHAHVQRDALEALRRAARN